MCNESLIQHNILKHNFLFCMKIIDVFVHLCECPAHIKVKVEINYSTKFPFLKIIWVCGTHLKNYILWVELLKINASKNI